MMKIVCITNDFHTLTFDKKYDVINILDSFYLILDDKGNKWWYPKERFKPLNEIRNNKIDKLLGE